MTVIKFVNLIVCQYVVLVAEREFLWIFGGIIEC